MIQESYHMAKKVLVIDDEIAILEVIKIILDCEGYVTETLPNGEKLLEKVKDNIPDIILLDFSLPGETGDTLARKLKSYSFTRNIPIIMLSAHYAVEELAASCGVNAFLPKPFSINDLIRMIEVYTEPMTS